MKIRKLTGWLFLACLILSIPFAGCSTTKSLYKKVTVPIAKMTGTKSDGLKKRVLLLPLVDQAELGEAKVAGMTESLVSLLEKGGHLVVKTGENPMLSSGKTGADKYGIAIDPDHAKKAEEMGMNVLLTLTLNPFEFQKTKTGIWPLRSVKWEVEVSISAHALDIINGTLYLTHLESDRIRLLDDLMEWEEEKEDELRRNLEEEKVQKTLSRLLADQASAIVDALAHEPWSGRILSTDGKDIVISAGKDIGLKKGSIFTVHGKGDPVHSASDRPIYLLGPKVGEIKTVAVHETHATAVPLTDAPLRAGQVIRLKR